MKIDLPVLGLAGCHGQKWKRLSRYVDWASPIHITVQQMRLRWMETSEAHSIPLHIWNENQVGTATNAQSKHKEVLHLCRWSTHTHLLRNILSNYWCGMHRTCKDTSVKPNRSGLMTKRVNIYIYIYCDIPATAPTEGVAVQGHCMQVRLHGSRGGVFVGHRPPRDPGGPLQD